MTDHEHLEWKDYPNEESVDALLRGTYRFVVQMLGADHDLVGAVEEAMGPTEKTVKCERVERPQLESGE